MNVVLNQTDILAWTFTDHCWMLLLMLQDVYRLNVEGILSTGAVNVDVFSNTRGDEGVNLDTKVTIYNGAGATLCTLTLILQCSICCFQDRASTR